TKDGHPTLVVGAAGVAAATGQGAVLGQLGVAQRLPATVLHRDAGQPRAERGEGQFHLGGGGGSRPGHGEAARWVPGEEFAPRDLGTVPPRLVHPPADARLDDDVAYLVLSAGERGDRPPHADGA